MARSHIEFILSNQVEQHIWHVNGIVSDARARTLSHDHQNGAATDLVSFPSGWSVGVGYFSADIEIFVLEGQLQIGPYRLKQHSYAYIPAGVCCGPWKAQSLTNVLWMPSASCQFTVSSEHSNDVHLNRYIPSIDTSALPWSGTITPGFPPGAMRKVLRTDPNTGASTWLLGVLPQWHDNRVEIHPVVEEAYLVIGDMKTPLGAMTPGSYFWRPAHIPHGPFATSTGALIIFRTDGPLRTDYIWPD
jgi:hypothetical protein